MTDKGPYVIGIAGGSGSGKTTVVRKILEKSCEGNTVIFQHDWYYKNFPHLSFEERSGLNYDHPDALETDLLASHLKEKIAGRSVTAPQYDFSTHLRKKEIKLLKPAKIIIVDGILILGDEELRGLMDLKIFVDADPDHRFIRRMERDIVERGRTWESVVNQYLHTVKPMHDIFVETSKRYADIIIPNGGKNSVAINLFTAKIESLLAGDVTLKNSEKIN